MNRVLCFLFFCLLSASVWAAPVLMESVAAVVDARPIMFSEVTEAWYQFRSTPAAATMSESAQKKFVLDQLIDQQVMMSRAIHDSIQVTDAEVEQRVTDQLSRIAASQNVTQEVLAKQVQLQLGMTLSQYREVLAKQFREHIYLMRLRQKNVGILHPTRKEVLAFYKNYKDSLPREYNCILVSHLQLDIKPNRRIVDSVKAVAELLIDSLDLGVDWNILAKNHSQDSSAIHGGDLGFFKKGILDPAYEEASERLDNGQYADKPVFTKDGWHIVRVLGRREDGVHSAHILLRTIPSSADSARVFAKADSLRNNIKTLDDFDRLATKFSQDESTNHLGGRLGWLERSAIKAEYVEPVSNLSVNDISDPILIDGCYHLFRLDDERQTRELTLEDDYEKVAAQAADHMETEKLKALVKKWRKEVYIELRMKF